MMEKKITAWLCFSELSAPKYNLIQHCSQKETDCWLLNSRNNHFLAPTVHQLEPKKKTSDSQSSRNLRYKAGFVVYTRVTSGLSKRDPRVQTSSSFKFSIINFIQPANFILTASQWCMEDQFIFTACLCIFFPNISDTTVLQPMNRMQRTHAPQRNVKL